VYPEPLFVTLKLVTAPEATTASAVARFMNPPPSNETNGGKDGFAYPEPALESVTDETRPPNTFATPAAPVPGAKVTNGGDE
jgi:hypothetical protein